MQHNSRPESYQWPKLSLQSTQLFIGSPLIPKMNFQLKIALIWQPKTLNPVAAQPKPKSYPVLKADVSHLTAAQHSLCGVWYYPYPKQDLTTAVMCSSHPTVFLSPPEAPVFLLLPADLEEKELRGRSAVQSHSCEGPGLCRMKECSCISAPCSSNREHSRAGFDA